MAETGIIYIEEVDKIARKSENPSHRNRTVGGRRARAATRHTSPPQFQSEPINGCIARFTTTLTSAQVLDHYRLTAHDAGWEVKEAGDVVAEPRAGTANPRHGHPGRWLGLRVPVGRRGEALPLNCSDDTPLSDLQARPRHDH